MTNYICGNFKGKAMGDFDEIDDLNDYGVQGGPSSASEPWNPDAVAIPVFSYSTNIIFGCGG
jgi:hypothetical protein